MGSIRDKIKRRGKRKVGRARLVQERNATKKSNRKMVRMGEISGYYLKRQTDKQADKDECMGNGWIDRLSKRNEKRCLKDNIKGEKIRKRQSPRYTSKEFQGVTSHAHGRRRLWGKCFR